MSLGLQLVTNVLVQVHFVRKKKRKIFHLNSFNISPSRIILVCKNKFQWDAFNVFWLTTPCLPYRKEHKSTEEMKWEDNEDWSFSFIIKSIGLENKPKVTLNLCYWNGVLVLKWKSTYLNDGSVLEASCCCQTLTAVHTVCCQAFFVNHYIWKANSPRLHLGSCLRWTWRKTWMMPSQSRRKRAPLCVLQRFLEFDLNE